MSHILTTIRVPNMSWLWRNTDTMDTTNRSNGMSTTKLIIVGTSLTTITIGTYLIANRYFRSKSSHKKNSTLTGDKHLSRKANGSVRHDTSVDREVRSLSTTSSSSTLTNINPASDLGSFYDITDSNKDSRHYRPILSLTPPNKCSNCCRTRRLSWRTSASAFKNMSVVQLINVGSDSLSSAIKAYEECTEKLMASGDHNETINSKLSSILEQLNSLSNDTEHLRTDCSPNFFLEEHDDDDFDRSSIISSATTTTLGYWDVEPNLHFFKLYQQALEDLNNIEAPRVDRTEHLGCESYNEFKAKVHCIRLAFHHIFTDNENLNKFKDMGKAILVILLNHSLRDPSECIAAYYAFLEFVSNAANHDTIDEEITKRGIRCLSFYDIVLDYMIMDSFDDLENPPSAVSSVANNRWLSAGFRELALQTAVSAVMRRKRSKLLNPSGFFAHFYSILDHVSPILAWGFLGSDQDLKLKCLLVKESLMEVIRDYFSFDRCRFTNVNDLSDDILRVTRERNWELNNKLSILST